MANFYRHYKNKDYRYIGIAKHSETLEELVVYRCLYENPQADLWVRPRPMFESLVTIEGHEQPRFAKVSFDIKIASDLDEKQSNALFALIQKIFPDFAFSRIGERLQNKRALILLAYFGEELVGFKIGYELHTKEFYSWLGAVSPDWRERGVASELMRVQHEWCRAHGYQNVSTKTKNSFREMLILNLRFDFKVVGLEDFHPEPKILLKKSLTNL